MAKAGKARKFDETVEIAMNLGVDPKRSDQV
jgi:ribosomal protein L1